MTISMLECDPMQISGLHEIKEITRLADAIYVRRPLVSMHTIHKLFKQREIDQMRNDQFKPQSKGCGL